LNNLSLIRTCLLATSIALTACVSAAGFKQAKRTMPPSWPYAELQLAPGVVPAQVAAMRAPAVAPPIAPELNAPPPEKYQATGSQFQFTQQEIGNHYAPVDWFPDDHPPMPETVAHGKPGIARACAHCHLPNGRGRPENAPVHGLSYSYIVQQMHAFQQGLRRSADPRKANTLEMENLARDLTEADIDASARYFSALKISHYIRVVETETIPTMRIQGGIYYPTADGQREPIGVRIIETPEDVAQTQIRNPHSGFIAYVPMGSVARGAELATTGGGKTLPCTSCHGPELRGIESAPHIAGLSPSYLARQMYDIKIGTRSGAMAALMVPAIANLSDAEIVDVIAYVSSRDP
jgi:cytochrome c553